jgi:Zn-dependent protease with chaperone function
LILYALLAVACGGCGTVKSIPVRESTEDERRQLSAAITPLLAELRDSAVHREGCKIGVAIVPSPRINAFVRAGTTNPCTTFTLGVTTGALSRLPPPILRAVLAHELGHVALHHTGKNTKAQEAEADTFAVNLLRRLEPTYPDACVQLVYVFSVMAEPAGSAWLAAHPSPERRAQTALDGCNR